MSLSEQLRRAVDESGLTLYAVAKRSGLTYSVLHRFVVKGQDIKLGSAEQLADLFSMRLTRPQKPKEGK